MTQPIQEPSVDRALQGLAYQRDQLLRRPAQAAASGLPVATMENPNITLSPAASRTNTDLTNFFTTDPGVFAENTVLTPNNRISILVPGVYAAFSQIKKITNNGTFEVYLHPSNTGEMFGGSAFTPYQTPTSFIDTDILLSVVTPYDISLLAFNEFNVPQPFTVKYVWTNTTGSPTVSGSSVVLVIVQLSPLDLFA